MTKWNSLYWSSDESSVPILAQFLLDNEYKPYNPFGRFPGMAYPQTFKAFVAPSTGGWVRILLDAGSDDMENLAIALSETADCLFVSLEKSLALTRVYHAGELLDLKTGLSAHVKVGYENELEKIVNAEVFNLPPIDTMPQVGDIRIDDMPEAFQAMTENINPKQADGMFKRLSRQFLKAVSPHDVSALFDSPPEWDSQGGQLIRAVMSCLPIGDTEWRTPDFASLRSAYTIQSRQSHFPDTKLLPGDEKVLENVPNALDYTPVYGGKSA